MLCSMRTRRTGGLFPVVALLVVLVACGSDGGDDGDADQEPSPTASSGAGPPSPSPPAPASAATEVLGEPGPFAAGGGEASPLDVAVDGRECVLTDALFGSCRASTGAGGPFVVTVESAP